MKRIQRYSANGFLAAVSLTAVLLSLELVARIYLRFVATEDAFRRYATTEQLSERFRTGKFGPHPYLRFYLTPNYVRGLNRHNSLGYRGQEILDKRADEFRIVCIGGSTTYTSGVSDYRLSYPELLQQHLKSMGFKNVNVINAGTPGWSTWESLVNLEFRVLDLDPDLVIIYHAVNDVGPRLVWPSDAYRGDNTGRHTGDPWFDSQHHPWHHSTLIRMLLIKLGTLPSEAELSFVDRPAATFYGHEFDRQSWRGEYPSGFFAEVSVDSMLRANPPVSYRRNLESMVALAQSRGIEVLLATFAFLPWREHARHSSWASDEYYRSIAEANVVVEQIADSTGLDFFDFANTFPQDKRLFVAYEGHGLSNMDPYHVNEEGAGLKAKLFAEFLVQRILRPSVDSVQEIVPRRHTGRAIVGESAR